MPEITLYVNPSTGKDSNTGTFNSPFKTLTKALSVATSGTTVQLSDGVYDHDEGEKFPLIVPSGVHILGNEAEKGDGVLIMGGGVYNSPSLQKQNVTIIVNHDAALRGVTLINPEDKGTGVFLETGTARITNNTIKSCGKEGILATGKSKPIIQNNHIFNNVFSGISCLKNAKGEIRNNLCQNTGIGITLTDGASPLLTDNQFTGNRIGVYLKENTNPVLRRNLIENNLEAGINAEGVAQPDLGNLEEIAGNMLRNNGEWDIHNETDLSILSVGNELDEKKVLGKVEYLEPLVLLDHSETEPSIFSDISRYWAEPFISALVKKEIIGGFPDGTFKPDRTITRAEFAALIAKCYDLPRQVGTKSDFSDVPNTFWAYSAIQKATAMGFLSGFPDGRFRPQRNLTRVQAIVALTNGLGLTGGNPNVLGYYRDRAQIPSYAVATIATATQKRMVVTYPDPRYLRPLEEISRAETVALLYQSLVIAEKAEAIKSSFIVTPVTFIPTFPDVEGHWAREFIRRLSQRELIAGFEDGTFKPDLAINRAQFAALLTKAFNPTPIRPMTRFSDIPPNFWANASIETAYRGGFLSGFPDQTFHPSQPLRRIHLIIALAQGLQLPILQESFLSIYEDRSTIPAYAESAVNSATKAGIVVCPLLYHLQPNEEVTRAEAASMLYQALVYQGKAVPIEAPQIIQV